MRDAVRLEVRYFLVALQFLTRIPVKSFADFQTVWLDRSTKYFPLVGAIVGGLSAAALLASALVLPWPVPQIIALVVGIAVTGAFHEDGLADTFDGLGGGLTRERRLEIMKDSRVGTYGVVGLLGVLALRAGCLSAFDTITAAKALFASHVVARFVPLLVMAALPYAGDETAAKVKPLATRITGVELTWAAMIAIGLGLVFFRPSVLAVGVLVSLICVWVMALQARRLIGGYTGDILGATEQVAETAFLLALAAMLVGPA